MIGKMNREKQIAWLVVLLTVALFFLFSFRKGPSQNNVMIKELQEAVKQQAQIIDDQAKQHKEEIENLNTISQLPWYKQLQDGQNLTTHSITTHRHPDLIIAGAKRCGAGPLKMFLNAHPQIKFRYEDAHFFDRGHKPKPRWTYKFMMPMTKNRKWLTAEKTPSYFTDPRVPKRIKEAFPKKEMKMIFLLCEPGRRAYSDYKFIHRTNMQHNPDHPRHSQVKQFGSFSDATDHYMNVIQAAYESNTLHQLIDDKLRKDSGLKVFTNSLYSVHTSRWLDNFDRDQLLFLDGETLFKDPVSEISRVEKFLGIKNELGPKNFVRDDTSNTFYCVKSMGYMDCTKPNKRLKWNPAESDRVEETIEKLEAFYRKINLENAGETLNQLLNTSYVWA